MVKRVVIVASGETERRALPRLLSHLQERDIAVDDVRIPPGNRALNVRMAERLIRSAWFERRGTPLAPDKFVVVVDTDRKEPDDVIDPFRAGLPGRLRDIGADVQYAYAQQHLEAWYFADEQGLRNFLCRTLGSVDASRPDEIVNPKLHLRNLLGERIYSARVSETIAGVLNAAVVAGRSPSFRGFLDAVANGPAASTRGQPTRADGTALQGEGSSQ